MRLASGIIASRPLPDRIGKVENAANREIAGTPSLSLNAKWNAGPCRSLGAWRRLEKVCVNKLA